MIFLDPSEVYSKGIERRKVRARSLFCYLTARELEIPITALCKKLHLSQAAVSLSVSRGGKIAKEFNISLFNEIIKLKM